MTLAAPRTPLRAAARLTAALLVGAALVTGARSADADNDVNLCPADRPCVTELSVSPYSVLQGRWSGDWDFYNVEVVGAGGKFKRYDLEAKATGFTLEPSAWRNTFAFNVQGCTSNFLASSTCSPWASRTINLSAPPAPTNVKLTGDTVSFDRLDGIVFNAELRGTQKADGKDVYITHRAVPVRSLTLPTGWQGRFSVVRLCAQNPGGTTCTTVPTRIIASPVVVPVARPDFVGVRVTQTADGAGGRSDYEVVIRNDGNAKGVATAVIGFTGVIAGDDLLSTPAGFTCTGTTTFTCTGVLGGTAEPIQERVAIFRVRGRVQTKGAGEVFVWINQDRTVVESTYDNNYKGLTVTAQ